MEDTINRFEDFGSHGRDGKTSALNPQTLHF